MNNSVLNKVMVGVSLAVTIALAVPLSLMTATIVRGESPRQLAEQSQAAASADDGGQPEDAAAEPEQIPIEDEIGTKPQVPPDPGPGAYQETQGESAAEPESQLEQEPTPKSEPEAKPRTSQPKPQKQASNVEKRNESQPKSASVVPDQVQQSEIAVPEPSYRPGEAPCMVEGLDDGLSYAQPVQQAQTTVQQATTSISQNAPPMVEDLGGYFYNDENSVQQSSSDTASNAAHQVDNGSTSSGNSLAQTYAHDFSGGRLLGTTQSDKYHNSDCVGARKIPPENEIWFLSTAEAEAKGYSACGNCYR